MKRFLVCLLLCVLVAANAFASSKLPDVDTFQDSFTAAARLSNSGHRFTVLNTSTSRGDLKTSVTVEFSKNLVMNIFVRNGTNDICEVILLSGGGDSDESINYIYAIGETLVSVGAVDELSETSDFLTKMGFFDHLTDGEAASIEIDGVKYSHIVSSTLGMLMFSVSVPY